LGLPPVWGGQGFLPENLVSFLRPCQKRRVGREAGRASQRRVLGDGDAFGCHLSEEHPINERLRGLKFRVAVERVKVHFVPME